MVCPCAFALNPELDVSQYAHTASKIRDGFTKGQIFQLLRRPTVICGSVRPRMSSNRHGRSRGHLGPSVWEDLGQLCWVHQIELWNRDEKEE